MSLHIVHCVTHYITFLDLGVWMDCSYWNIVLLLISTFCSYWDIVLLPVPTILVLVLWMEISYQNIVLPLILSFLFMIFELTVLVETFCYSWPYFFEVSEWTVLIGTLPYSIPYFFGSRCLDIVFSLEHYVTPHLIIFVLYV